jgi:hypothetical protein
LGGGDDCWWVWGGRISQAKSRASGHGKNLEAKMGQKGG